MVSMALTRRMSSTRRASWHTLAGAIQSQQPKPSFNLTFPRANLQTDQHHHHHIPSPAGRICTVTAAMVRRLTSIATTHLTNRAGSQDKLHPSEALSSSHLHPKVPRVPHHQRPRETPAVRRTDQRHASERYTHVRPPLAHRSQASCHPRMMHAR
jgi:hypothetical protein